MKRLLLAVLLLHNSIVPSGWDYVQPRAVVGGALTIVGSLASAFSISMATDSKDSSPMPLVFFTSVTTAGGLGCCILSLCMTRQELQKKRLQNKEEAEKRNQPIGV